MKKNCKKNMRSEESSETPRSSYFFLQSGWSRILLILTTAVHNSLTANSKVFETAASEEQQITCWINLLNLNDHFDPITKPAGFFGMHYWCELCNKCFHDKQEHKCIPTCVACKTLTQKTANFGAAKRRIVTTVSGTFLATHVWQITRVSQVKLIIGI